VSDDYAGARALAGSRPSRRPPRRLRRLVEDGRHDDDRRRDDHDDGDDAEARPGHGALRERRLGGRRPRRHGTRVPSDGRWAPDTSGLVRISILGPRGSAAATPQVAAELAAKTPLVESTLWVDGTELQVKGGGLTPTRGTIYGAPSSPLRAGTHVAVAYARTASHATAVAWTFRVG